MHFSMVGSWQAVPSWVIFFLSSISTSYGCIEHSIRLYLLQEKNNIIVCRFSILLHSCTSSSVSYCEPCGMWWYSQNITRNWLSIAVLNNLDLFFEYWLCSHKVLCLLISSPLYHNKFSGLACFCFWKALWFLQSSENKIPHRYLVFSVSKPSSALFRLA